jgi:hypothetical protein
MKYLIVNVVVSALVLILGCSKISADQDVFNSSAALEGGVNEALESIGSSSLFASASQVTFQFDIVESGDSIQLRLDHDAQDHVLHALEILTPWGEFSVPVEVLSEFIRPDLFFMVDYALTGHAETQSLSEFSLLFSYDPGLKNDEEGCEWSYSDAYINVDQFGIRNIEVERHSGSGIEAIFERETLPRKKR